MHSLARQRPGVPTGHGWKFTGDWTTALPKNACNGASNVTFPQEIRNFSDAFKQLQAARHSADYDPMIRLDKIEALGFITLAEDSIAALKGVRAIDKIAFATWGLIASKGANEARSRVKEGRIRQV